MSRRVVVTGAGGTMGRAVVEALLADGCRVAAIDIHPDSMRPLVVANDGARALFERATEQGGYRLVGVAD